RPLKIKTGVNQARFMTFDRDASHLAFGSEPPAKNAVVGARELEFGRGIYPLLGLKGAARKVWFSSNGRRLAAWSDDWHVGVWSMDSYRLVRILEAPVGSLADNAGGAFDST